MFVDLHIHSYFSDGAQTPEQAALACRDSGVGLAALCDLTGENASEAVIEQVLERFCVGK